MKALDRFNDLCKQYGLQEPLHKDSASAANTLANLALAEQVERLADLAEKAADFYLVPPPTDVKHDDVIVVGSQTEATVTTG